MLFLQPDTSFIVPFINIISDSAWLNRSCDSNGDCPADNSECYNQSSTCVCTPGYYYSVNFDTCVRGTSTVSLTPQENIMRTHRNGNNQQSVTNIFANYLQLRLAEIKLFTQTKHNTCCKNNNQGFFLKKKIQSSLLYVYIIIIIELSALFCASHCTFTKVTSLMCY